jgi:hypothetical protein
MPNESARDLLLAELRIALLRSKSAQAEIEFLGAALKQGILSEAEVFEALANDIGWGGFLNKGLMDKIRKACGADVG